MRESKLMYRRELPGGGLVMIESTAGGLSDADAVLEAESRRAEVRARVAVDRPDAPPAPASPAG